MDSLATPAPPFGSRAVGRVLQIMALNPDRPFFVRELARLTGERVNGIAQALARLVREGMAFTIELGDRPGYEMRSDYLYLREIQHIALKSLGIPELLDAAGVTALKVAVYGSYARGDAQEHSDIDVLVVGSEPRPGASETAVAELARRVGREISVTVLDHATYTAELAHPASFVSAVVAGPTVELRGKL